MSAYDPTLLEENRAHIAAHREEVARMSASNEAGATPRVDQLLATPGAIGNGTDLACLARTLERELAALRQPVGGEAGEVVDNLVAMIEDGKLALTVSEAKNLRKAAALIEALASRVQELEAHKLKMSKLATPAEFTVEQLRKAESELAALRAPLPEVEEQVVTYDDFAPNGDHRTVDMVPADYARKLAAQLREAQKEIKEMIESEKLSMQRAERAERERDEAVRKEREAIMKACDILYLEHGLDLVSYRSVLDMLRARSEGGRICKRCGVNVGDGDIDGCRAPNCPEAK